MTASETSQARDARQRSSPRLGRGWTLAAGVGLSAVIGALVALLGDASTPASATYTQTPAFKVYAVVLVALWASMPVAWRLGTDALRGLNKKASKVLGDWAPAIIFGVLVVAAAAFFAGRYARGSGAPLYLGVARVLVTYVAGAVAASPPIVAMWVTFTELRTPPVSTTFEDRLKVVNKLLELQQSLRRALCAAGALVSVGVLATGAERQAWLAYAPRTNSYPSAYVLIWGLAFSALLVVNFVPAFQRLNKAARDTLGWFPLVPPGERGWRVRLADRSALSDLLSVGASARDTFTSIVVVAAPLLTSAISLFLPTNSQ